MTTQPSRRGSPWGRAFLVLAAVLVVGAGVATWRVLESWRPEGVGGVAGMLGGLGEQRAAWLVENQPELLEPADPQGEPQTFTVRPGEAIVSVAQRLSDLSIVQDAEAFTAFARVTEADTKVQAGDHVVSAAMSAEEVLEALMIAEGDQVQIVLPEGLRAEEVADRLASAGVADRDAFLALVEAGDAGADLPAVAARPEGASLEGYLFPDTYKLEPEAGADTVLRRLLETFAARMPADAETAAQRHDLTLFEAVTLASIVERETPLPDERPEVARAYLNRLAEAPFILNADPTVQYALGFQSEQGEDGSWWKRPLLLDDLDVDSPYNTYRVAGLPPGPIANPGLASIEAVLTPAENDWHYFVANDVACDGSHVFARTLEEHQANIARYQNEDCRK